MKHSTDFMEAIADFDLYPDTVIMRAGSPTAVRADGLDIVLEVPFRPYVLDGGLVPAEGIAAETRELRLRLFSFGILRLTTSKGPALPASPMMAPAADLEQLALSVDERPGDWLVKTSDSTAVAIFEKESPPADGWSDLIRASFDSLSADFFPETASVSLSARDQFFPEKVESLPLAFIPKQASLFSFTADYNEHFAGTGERFARMDLAGGTYSLENTDGLGNNSRRAYKNVPFYLSSRGYGLFVHTSAHMRLSVADVSTRAVQGRIEEDELDLFIIEGQPEEILLNYRRLTGFPPALPIWSYGTWMAKMTYFSADEIEEITVRLRDEKYPCDLIHIDTGWFETDWVCEWKFSSERFPDPKAFISRLKDDGFRVSLWQTPNIGERNCLLDEAKAQRFLAPPKSVGVSTASDFSGQDFGGQIDFTNPAAVDWYKERIRPLLEMGAAVIKTDFGEKIQFDADYMNMPAEKLHNIYGLLYQKAAFEQTRESTGEGIIWARAGWAGCQRYPLHWGGDTASSWDGMAAVLRGGLHLGLSGYGFWSHDVPGFHGIPEFMNTPPSNELYIRWTQFGVFTSHLRYHGTSAREPWHFPEIAPLIRRWLNLRYALIPYLLEQAEKTCTSGFPMLRAMILHQPDDPVCWNIDDQFFCGDDILVCPVMNKSGTRDVYLPEGAWVDFWNGKRITGGRRLRKVKSPLERLPVYVADGAELALYPEPVQCTDEMDLSKTVRVKIDENFKGVSSVYPEPDMLP